MNYLEFPCDVERLENGNTLICDAGGREGDGSQVIEVAPDGQIVWAYREGLSFAHGAKRLPNGNTLIADTNHDRVIEVTPQGEVVYDSSSINGGLLSDGTHLRYTNDAHQLEDGTLLITDRNNNRCVMIDRQNQVLWSYDEGIRHPHNCDMLPNGHVMIADSDGNRVLEVDRDKRIVWAYTGGEEGLSWPRDADRLPNGNTLIVNSRDSSLLEVTPGGEIVWRHRAGHFANYYDADLTPQGTILFSDQQRHQVVEINRAGEVVWRYRHHELTQPLFDRLQNGSFKRRDEQGNPYGWFLHTRLAEGGGVLVWDETASPRPMPGIAYDRGGVCCLSQLVRVEPGVTYTMAASVKVAQVEEGGFCYLQMAFIDAQDAFLTDATKAPKGTFFTEVCDYTQDSFQATAPEGAAYAEVRLVTAGSVTAFMKSVFLTDF